jgi:hypothetical protein
MEGLGISALVKVYTGGEYDPMSAVPLLPGEIDEEREQLRKDIFQFVEGFGLVFPKNLRETVHNMIVSRSYSDVEAEEIITDIFPYWSKQ